MATVEANEAHEELRNRCLRLERHLGALRIQLRGPLARLRQAKGHGGCLVWNVRTEEANGILKAFDDSVKEGL